MSFFYQSYDIIYLNLHFEFVFYVYSTTILLKIITFVLLESKHLYRIS